MAESDTAVMEPDTAVEALDTATIDVIEDGEIVGTTVVTPDTESSETPDTGDEAPKLTPEEVEARIADERTKWETENRTLYEEAVRTQAANERRTQAQQLRTGQTAARLEGIVKWAYQQGEEGKDFRFDPRSVGALATQMEAAVFQDQSDAWSEAFNGYLAKVHPDFKPSQQTAQRLAAAFRDWNPGMAVEAQFTAMQEAIKATIEPQLRKEIEADIKQKNEAAGKTQALRAADTTRRVAGRPTASGDAGGGDRAYTLQEIDAMPTSQWLGMEKATRDRILSDAHRRAGR